ncbi:hypothetical protein L207DRAFT_642331 [Hyaloscypha variabilis F]|uniref:2EXR domain-containing protein n=1 Tax=Hyaloscypha variabilis (strain UAMH 11265 / GT02V1 / F) TaxID=1149755 RepID=A0A2J6QTJ1_HYAVF|nr:hypothetical protein L207DRAFT_642331 [Hyaloscypha variabilis F]
MSENNMENQSAAKVQVLHPSLYKPAAEHSSSLLDIQAKLTSIHEQNIELHLENKLLRNRIRTLEVRLASTKDTLINLSPQTLGTQTHKAFALFPKLPPELRRIVWDLARPSPRVIKLFHTKVNDVDILYSTAKVPSLLHTCQESRRVAKSWYELSLGYKSNFGKKHAAHVYFDYSRDFLYSPLPDLEDERSYARSIAYPRDVYYLERTRVKKVVQEIPRIWEQFDLLSIYFPSAVEALLVDTEDGMFHGAADQPEFIVTGDAFPWQRGRTLQKVYEDVREEMSPYLPNVVWNLTSIRRARFARKEV